MADDFFVFEFEAKQTMGGDNLKYVETDRYFLDVYFNSDPAIDTDWKMHTHEMIWEDIVKIRKLLPKPVKAEVRKGTIKCKNKLNGVFDCSLPVTYMMNLHFYVIRDGKRVEIQNKRGRVQDWRGCHDIRRVLDNTDEPIKDEGIGAVWFFCTQGSFHMTMPSGCGSVPRRRRIPAPFACPINPVIAGGRVDPIDVFNQAPLSGTISQIGFPPTGPPDYYLNAVYGGGVGNDCDGQGPDACDSGNMGANWVNGTHYPNGYGNGVYISGIWRPSGVNGNPTGCSICPYNGNDAPSNPPPATGSGCGDCTYSWNSGIIHWDVVSDGCSQANCQFEESPAFPAATGHGHVRTTGCENI